MQDNTGQTNNDNPKKRQAGKGQMGYRVSVIINRLKANLVEVEPGESRIRKILYYAKLKSKSMYKFITSILRTIYVSSERWPVTIVKHVNGELQTVYSSYPYDIWMAKNFPKEGLLLSHKRSIRDFSYQPCFKLILPIENIPADFLENTIQSVIRQIYSNWNLTCICGPQTPANLRSLVERATKQNPNLTIVDTTEETGSARAKNQALRAGQNNEEYVSVIKCGDILLPDALFQYVKTLNDAQEKPGLVYADDDCINGEQIHFDPRFKQDWNPDTFLSQNYIGNTFVVKTDLLKQTNGWNETYGSAHEYELIMRLALTEHITIKHIPMVLYSVLVTEHLDNSRNVEADFAINVCAAIEHTMLKGGEKVIARPASTGPGFEVRYALEGTPKISIVIPTKDKIEVLQKCVDSIFAKSTYKHYEIILIDNNSSHQDFFDKVEQWKKEEPDRFRCVRTEAPFNFSYLMNLGFTESKGDYLVLLNNDTEVISPDWLEAMLEQAQRRLTGVVGVKLLYPNDTVQHAGVVVGLGGGAGHVLIGKPPREIAYMNYLNLITNYSALTAACVMISKEKYDKAGRFDEDFAVEFNDVDFCLRVKELGLHNVYLPHVELYHYESISRGHPLASKVSYERHIKEFGMVQTRWKRYILNDPCYNPNLTLSNEQMSVKI